MIQPNRRSVVLGAIAAGTALAWSPAHAAKDPVFATKLRGIAIRGTDVVAYFTQGGPVPGRSEHETEWNGARWRFSSAEHLRMFQENPDAYAPQYGGYCAWAVANGYTASTVPEAWEIVDGKLYLNYSLGVREQWKQDIPGNIRRGDANWPGVLD